ncbi:MAG: 8-oxo-dGTP pyrophosphatase MutT (NUDIX family) [Polyangiales bacterium]|jgi:8-oxo-dGTP pyrophosphatase MutT (NUDIX family)
MELERIKAALKALPFEVAAPEGRAAAVAVVFVEAPLRVLFIRRAESERDPWSGQMAFPGGRHEESDGDLLVTAIRETHEELGLDLSDARCLGGMEYVEAVANGRRLGLRIRPFFFVLPEIPELTPNYEVAEALWGELAPMWRHEVDTEQEWTTGDQRIRFPGFDVNGHTVWGLTYLMLRRLFQAIGES